MNYTNPIFENTFLSQVLPKTIQKDWFPQLLRAFQQHEECPQNFL
jgi:hypothetical protein